MKGNSARKESTNGSELQQAVVRACDMCRKKKIRCEPTGDTCLQCIKYKTNCHFTPISTKRKPRRPAGYKNVEELEERLQRMEGLLKIAVERGSIGSKDIDLQAQNPTSIPIEVELVEQIDSVQEVCMSLSTPESLGINTPMTSQLRPAQFGQLNKSLDPEETMSYAPRLTNDWPSPMLAAWKGSIVTDVFSRRTFRELPPKSVALGLIDEAFKSFNSTFPIFDQGSFMQLFQDHYSESGPSDAGWWACINVVLALAHRFRAMRTLETGSENSAACGYMQNALGVVSELTMLDNNLAAVQALLGMTIVLQGTPNPRLCSVLIAACVRLAQTMGLHRRNHDPHLTEAEIEERKNVFWLAYLLDRDISLRTGQPPAQDDDDMDVELPSGRTLSGSRFPLANLQGKGLDTFNFFNSRIRLAIIQGQIYKRLYSVKAARQPEAQQLVAAQELDSILASWRSNVPIDFEDNTLITIQPPITPEVLHMIILRFNYVSCLISIHRPFPSTDVSQLNPDNNLPIDPALGVQSTLSPEGICIIEARKAIRLIQITPQGDYACAWLLIHLFFAAVTALLQNVVLSPAYYQARSDLHLVRPFLQLLDILAGEGKSEEVQRMYEFCVDLNGKAKDAVERVNRKVILPTASKSEVQGGKESVEEFIRRVECISAGCPSSQTQAFVSAEGNGSMVEPWENGDATMTGFGDFSDFDI